MKSKIALALLMALTIAACDENSKNDEQIGCSSDITTKTFLDLVRDSALENLSNNLADYQDVTNQTKRSALGNLAFNISQITTVSSDSGSSMKTCEATVSMTVNPETYMKLSESYKKHFDRNLDKELENLSLNVNANVFSSRITYTSQPTDDKKTVFVKLISPNNPVSSGAALVSAISIITPIIEQNHINQQIQVNNSNVVQSVQQEQPIQQESVVQQSPQQVENSEPRTINEARIAFSKVDSELNTLWSSLTKERKKELLPSQRQWIRNKDAMCGKISIKGDETTIINSLNCQTQMTKERIKDIY